MHKKLLTESERKIMVCYLETGNKLEGYRIMLHRLRKNPIQKSIIEEDLKLLEKFLAKAEIK
jgi:hypothetical protein